MREIKFRGKSIDLGIWVYGSLILSYPYKDAIDTAWIKTENLLPLDPNIPTCKFIEVDAKTVGQFTCRPDKHEKEIYEGDWLRFVEEHEVGCQCEHCWPCRIGEIVGVKWVNDRWHLLPARAYLNGEEGERKDYCEECSSRGGLYSPNHEIPIGCYAEVIGNIHDNPEFLGVKLNIIS